MEFTRSAGETVKILIPDKRDGSGSCDDGMFNRKEQSYALDNICYSAGAVVARISQFVHAGRVHSHPARDRGCGADYPSDLRTAGIMTSKR